MPGHVANGIHPVDDLAALVRRERLRLDVDAERVRTEGREVRAPPRRNEEALASYVARVRRQRERGAVMGNTQDSYADPHVDAVSDERGGHHR